MRNSNAETPKTPAQRIRGNLALHLHPVKVPSHALKLTYTWGLGGLSVLMFLVLTVTGILLMFYYVPAVPDAYLSMHRLDTEVVLGRFVRNLHRWAAHGMVITAWLHMCRVFYTGAYKRPRQSNWLIGLGLLVITLLLSFTGYLLPWDQLAYWATTIGANMARSVPLIGRFIQRLLLGGYEIGPATLIRWYTLHVFVLPLMGVVLMAMHFWRIRRRGMATPAPAAETVNTWPHLVSIEAITALAALLVLFILATFLDAPLLAMANPFKTPNPAKAPWYFAGLQELLLHMHPALAGVFAPAALLLLLGLIPYLDRDQRGSGIWFGARRSLPIAGIAFGWTAALETGLILLHEFAGRPASSSWLGAVLLPLALMAAIPGGLLVLLRRLYRDLDRPQLMVALFSLLLTSFVVLTVIAAFRGPGMELMWPWSIRPPV